MTLLIVSAWLLLSSAKSLQTSSDDGLRAAIASDAVRDGSSEASCSLELRQLRREEHSSAERRGRARQTPTAAVTFVKFHQVGGTSAQKTVRKSVTKKDLEDNRVTALWSHESLQAAAAWAKDGSVPQDTFVTALLRHPIEKFLSSFFKHEFPSVRRHGKIIGYKPSYVFDHLFGPGAKRSLEGMQNLSAAQEAIRTILRGSGSCINPKIDGMWKSWIDSGRHCCEYTRVLGDERLSGAHRAEAAIALLQQFAVVGITERFEDWKQNTCIGLGDLTKVNCSAKSTIPTDRKSQGHPKMADFPDHFVEELMKYLEFDMAVYREAQRLADFGPRQHVRLARHVP